MSNLVVAAVPQTQTGVASGMNANIRTIGGAIGGAVVATVVTSNLRADGLPTESGYTHGFTVLVVSAVAAAVVAIFVPVVRAADPRRARPAGRGGEPKRSALRPDPLRVGRGAPSDVVARLDPDPDPLARPEVLDLQVPGTGADLRGVPAIDEPVARSPALPRGDAAAQETFTFRWPALIRGRRGVVGTVAGTTVGEATVSDEPSSVRVRTV